MLRALPSRTAQREMENLLLAQHRSEARFRQHNLSMELGELELVVGAIDACSSHGTGGGYKVALEPGS